MSSCATASRWSRRRPTSHSGTARCSSGIPTAICWRCMRSSSEPGRGGSRQIALVAPHRPQMEVDLLAALVDRLPLLPPLARAGQQENQAADDKGGAADNQCEAKGVHALSANDIN